MGGAGVGKSALRRSFSKNRRRWKASWVDDLSQPGARTSAYLDALVFDHGALRLAWHNQDRIAEGVYRSNQPCPARIFSLAAKGFRTIVNLRGESDWGSYLLEREACLAAGLELIDFKLRSWQLPLPEQIVELTTILSSAPRPLLMHCKSGADRVGLGAMIYQLGVAGLPVEIARRQLSLRYMHLPTGRTGILDLIPKAYAAATQLAPVPFLDWVRDGYDPAALTARYRPGRMGTFLVQGILRRE